MGREKRILKGLLWTAAALAVLALAVFLQTGRYRLYHAGGQSDGIFLLALDPKEGRASMICIPRDTMADVDFYDEAGEYLVTGLAQITLQHGYGDGAEYAVLHLRGDNKWETLSASVGEGYFRFASDSFSPVVLVKTTPKGDVVSEEEEEEEDAEPVLEASGKKSPKTGETLPFGGRAL